MAMQDFWGAKNFGNLGYYKESILNGNRFLVDTVTYNKATSHIDRITDTLFIPLSCGVKTPAVYTTKIAYDSTTKSFYQVNSEGTYRGLLSGITTVLADATNELSYIDVSFSSSVTSLSDITPVIYLQNNTRGTVFPHNQIPNLRVSEYIVDGADHTCRIVAETLYDSTWGNIKLFENDDWTVFTFTIEPHFQSVLDNTDTYFLTPSIPYFDSTYVQKGVRFIRVYGTVYNDLIPDASRSLWSSKLRIRAQEYDADTSTLTGGYYYSDWADEYVFGITNAMVDNLAVDTSFAIWAQIDSEIGPDNMDWTYVTTTYTYPKGAHTDYEYEESF